MTLPTLGASAKQGEINVSVRPWKQCEKIQSLNHRRSKLELSLRLGGFGRALSKRAPRCPLKGIWTSPSSEEVSACLHPYPGRGAVNHPVQYQASFSLQERLCTLFQARNSSDPRLTARGPLTQIKGALQHLPFVRFLSARSS